MSRQACAHEPAAMRNEWLEEPQLRRLVRCAQRPAQALHPTPVQVQPPSASLLFRCSHPPTHSSTLLTIPLIRSAANAFQHPALSLLCACPVPLKYCTASEARQADLGLMESASHRSSPTSKRPCCPIPCTQTETASLFRARKLKPSPHALHANSNRRPIPCTQTQTAAPFPARKLKPPPHTLHANSNRRSIPCTQTQTAARRPECKTCARGTAHTRGLSTRPHLEVDLALRDQVGHRREWHPEDGHACAITRGLLRAIGAVRCTVWGRMEVGSGGGA
eukprot:363579-Chlamydomonas_euryale.AAC.6